MLAKPVTLSRRNFDAAVFDLDGVLTDTARVHAAAWKAAFDTFLLRWTQRHGLTFQPFDIEADYLAYVDGRPRHDGVRSFLAARGIHLPEGSEQDPEDANTVGGIGAHKTRLFRQALQQGIAPESGARDRRKHGPRLSRMPAKPRMSAVRAVCLAQDCEAAQRLELEAPRLILA